MPKERLWIYKVTINVLLGLAFIWILYHALGQSCVSLPTSSSDTDQNIPRFVLQVWPAADSSVPELCFKHNVYIPNEKISNPFMLKGIGVRLSTIEIDDFSKISEVDEELSERTELFVDGNIVTYPNLKVIYEAVSLVIKDDQGNFQDSGEAPTYVLVSLIPLTRGKHIAEIRTTNNVGKIYQYQWEFNIR